MAGSDAQIRVLTPRDVEELVDWAAGEGWNPGLGDAQAFRAADPNGFLGCFVQGKLAAGISAVRYDEDFGFIGLYICRPEFRGQGLGRQVWDAGMAHLSGATIGLDGVAEQQGNYGRMGFRPVYDTVRWSIGSAPSGEAVEGGAPAVTVGDIADIISFDLRFFPARREAFLSAWLRAPRRAVIRRVDGHVAGYAVMRPCRQGYKIGPLFARDDATAEWLLMGCASALPGVELHIDVPDYQRQFGGLLAGLGFSRGFRTARMYRGAPPRLESGGVYAVTTLELG